MERQNQKLRSLPPGAIAFMKKVAKRNILGEKPGPGGRQRVWKSPEQPTESKGETPFSQGSKAQLIAQQAEVAKPVAPEPKLPLVATPP